MAALTRMAGAVLLLAVLLLAHSTGSHASCPFHRKKAVSSSTGKDWFGEIPEAENSRDPLVAINDVFHKVYEDAGFAMLPTPIVVVESDYLVVLRRNKDGAFERDLSLPFTPVLYHDLKMVSHITFMLTTGLGPYFMGLQPFPLTLLQSTYQGLPIINATLAARFSDPTVLQRQYTIINRVYWFLVDALDAKAVKSDAAVLLAQSQASDIMLNVRDAGIAQIDMLIKTLNVLRNDVLKPDEWDGLRFIVHTSHMADEKNLVSQVFSRLLSKDPTMPDMGPNDPNWRFITLDDATMDEDTALALLRTHYTDYYGGQEFFSDSFRLHRDILADAAEAYLNQLYPAPPHK